MNRSCLLWFLLGSLILAFALSFISRGLWGGFLVRWLTTAIVTFPVIYITFDELVLPLAGEYYVQGGYELALPSWSQIIPLQLARSVLFLLVCLPVLVMWHGSRRSLVLSLGLAISVLVGFMSVITSYWFPWQMRLFHRARDRG